MIRNLCCCFLLTLGAIGMAAQQADPRESKLLVLERLWNEAQVNRDSAALGPGFEPVREHRVGRRTERQEEISCRYQRSSLQANRRQHPRRQDELFWRHGGGHRYLSHSGHVSEQAL